MRIEVSTDLRVAGDGFEQVPVLESDLNITDACPEALEVASTGGLDLSDGDETSQSRKFKSTPIGLEGEVFADTNR